MAQSLSLSQTEITPEYADLNTILALADEWRKQALRGERQTSDFALPGATQFPGGGTPC
jgi:hypothetical protein